MSHTITLIPGDGIGPEVTAAVVRIFAAAGLDIDWDRHDAGVVAFKKYGQSLPPQLLDSVKRNQVALEGPVTTPIAQGFTSVSVGLFLDSCRHVAKEYTDVTYDERIVDAACMHLVMHPEKLDVLLLPNLYGDIVSDLCAGLVGGLGVVPGANIGLDAAVFEAVH